MALAALAVALMGPSVLVAASPLGGAEPHPAVCRVVVQERDGEAYGSGTLIDCREQYGMVVTNWHVVRDATGKIEVVFPSGFRSEARPLKLDETWDLAALVIWRPPTEPAELAAHPPMAGDVLTICGYGAGDYRSQTGRCTDYYSPEVGLPQELVELSVEARQGDSGGPIFNDRGELAGVLFGAGQGTTLGSFGGRVKTFLATLAPDIGSPPKTRIASTPLPSPFVPSSFPAATRPTRSAVATPAPSPPAASPRPVRPATSAVDPFLAAESSAAARGLAASAIDAAVNADIAKPQAAPAPTDPWRRGQPATVSQAPFVPSPAPSFSTNWSAPLATATPERRVISDEPDAQAIDWYDDGRTLLSIVGGAALLLGVMRSLG